MPNVTIQIIPLRSTFWACCVLLCAGFVSVLSFAPLSVVCLYPLAQALLFSMWMRSRSGTQAMCLGLCFGIGCFSGVSWLVLPLYHFSVLFAVLGVCLVLLLVLCLALFPALVGFLFVRSGRSLWLLPLLWTVQEYGRSLIFPWLLSGYTHSLPQDPLFVLAPVVGVLGIGWFQAFLIVLLLGLCYRQLTSFIVMLWLIIFCCALLFMPRVWVKPAGLLPLDALQTRVPAFLKWEVGHTEHAMQQYNRLMERTRPRALVILPETAISWVLRSEDLPVISHVFKADRDILIGAPYKDGADHLYNAALLLTQHQKKLAYAKRHLVPFGEYFPHWLFWLHPLLPVPMSHFVAGVVNQAPLLWRGYPLGILICYEDVFPHEFRHLAMLSTALINMTNDDWFHPSWMQEQHVQMARMTARMLGRPLLRVSNGILTSAIDAQGEIQDVTFDDQPAVLSVDMMIVHGVTPLMVFGHFLYLMAVLLGAFSQYVTRRHPVDLQRTVRPRRFWWRRG